MAQPIELTAEQLSALDQIISQKQKGEAIFGDIINVVQKVVPVVVAVTQVVAGAAVSGESLASSSLKDVVKNIPVDKLIELRKSAIQKG